MMGLDHLRSMITHVVVGLGKGLFYDLLDPIPTTTLSSTLPDTQTLHTQIIVLLFTSRVTLYIFWLLL
jgi:hypothetical protein